MKNSLKNRFIMITILSFGLLVLIVSVVGYTTVYHSMAEQEKIVMKSVISTVKSEYDKLYPGEYGIELKEDGTYYVYKGRSDISDNYDVINVVKQNFGYDMSLFCKNIRVLTTFQNDEGEPLVSTRSATAVDSDVVEEGKAHFYSNVRIGEQSYFAYYEPIILSDGRVYGMFGVCCPAASVQRSAFRVSAPLALICAVMAMIFCFISIRYSRAVVDRFTALGRFMSSVAEGNFLTEVDPILNSDDEIGHITVVAKKMQRDLQILVETDTLTKLNNRRYGGNRLRLVSRRAKESGMPFCVCIGDIDFFKKINDVYGHDVGDIVLKEVADVLKRHMVGKGFAARWGGEEFLLVYETVGLEQAIDSVQAIMDEIRAMRIESGEDVIRLTMSFGMVEGDAEISDDMLLKGADDNLYYAKNHGRDRMHYEK